jgi:hypothetical protein
MDPAPRLVIHEVLPSELLGVIFEEHAKLDWKAPVIDGQVCRLWRQIVLNAPRAWAYLEICDDKQPRVGELRLWLHRSAATPLHIRVNTTFKLNERISKQEFHDLLSGHHIRIASLRMRSVGSSFFERREFPYLQLLDIEDLRGTSFSDRWGPMPELWSLRLGVSYSFMVPLSDLDPLEVLILGYTNKLTFTSLVRHYRSLTTLMLDDVSLRDTTSGPVAFPSLTYLSLYDVMGLKPSMDVPRLCTYHEGGVCTVRESFRTPLPSLVEYGVYDLSASNSDPAKWALSIPNILRLSIRASRPVLLSFLDTLAHQPHSLPMLRTISVANSYGDILIPEEVQRIMEGLILVRSEACQMEVTLCCETGSPFQIPMFFGGVSDLSIR